MRGWRNPSRPIRLRYLLLPTLVVGFVWLQLDAFSRLRAASAGHRFLSARTLPAAGAADSALARTTALVQALASSPIEDAEALAAAQRALVAEITRVQLEEHEHPPFPPPADAPDGAGPIPRVIHLSWRDTQIPAAFADNVLSWMRVHAPARVRSSAAAESQPWVVVLWTDEANANLVDVAYPALTELYNRYSGIQRADLSRYLYMQAVGGVYADLDFRALRPFDPLLGSAALLLGQEPPEHALLLERQPRQICNAILLSRPRHPFWASLLSRIGAYAVDEDAPASTGPRMLEKEVRHYESGRSGRESGRRSGARPGGGRGAVSDRGAGREAARGRQLGADGTRAGALRAGWGAGSTQRAEGNTESGDYGGGGGDGSGDGSGEAGGVGALRQRVRRAAAAMRMARAAGRARGDSVGSHSEARAPGASESSESDGPDSPDISSESREFDGSDGSSAGSPPAWDELAVSPASLFYPQWDEMQRGHLVQLCARLRKAALAAGWAAAGWAAAGAAAGSAAGGGEAGRAMAGGATDRASGRDEAGRRVAPADGEPRSEAEEAEEAGYTEAVAEVAAAAAERDAAAASGGGRAGGGSDGGGGSGDGGGGSDKAAMLTARLAACARLEAAGFQNGVGAGSYAVHLWSHTWLSDLGLSKVDLGRRFDAAALLGARRWKGGGGGERARGREGGLGGARGGAAGEWTLAVERGSREEEAGVPLGGRRAGAEAKAEATAKAAADEEGEGAEQSRPLAAAGGAAISALPSAAAEPSASQAGAAEQGGRRPLSGAAGAKPFAKARWRSLLTGPRGGSGAMAAAPAAAEEAEEGLSMEAAGGGSGQREPQAERKTEHGGGGAAGEAGSRGSRTDAAASEPPASATGAADAADAGAFVFPSEEEVAMRIDANPSGTAAFILAPTRGSLADILSAIEAARADKLRRLQEPAASARR